MGNRPLVDVEDRAVGLDEQHVERDERVAHPERGHLLLAEIEQHAGIRRHALAEHQATGAAFVAARQFYRDMLRALRRPDPQIAVRQEIGRASYRERGCRSVEIAVGGVSLKKKKKKK